MKTIGLRIIIGTVFFVMLTAGDYIISSSAQGATITGQTSMTVVNVDNWQTPDKSHWYPRVYINGVHIQGYHAMGWSMSPNPLPWGQFPNTVAGVLSAIWTNNGGITWSTVAWDYIGVSTTGKHMEGQMPGNSQWVGTFISTLCDHKPGECNGRERSNVYFTTETF